MHPAARVAGALSALLCATACLRCGGAEPAPRAVVQELTIAVTSEPDGLCPLLSENAVAAEVTALMQRELVVNDPAWQPVADLADHLPLVGTDDVTRMGSGIDVHWRLRADAAWDDGRPVVADDFLLAFALQRDPAQQMVRRADVAAVTSMTADPDGRGFVVHWTEPRAGFADTRVHRPLPAHVLRPLLDDGAGGLKPLKSTAYCQHPLSNGPFRLVAWHSGQDLTFERNPFARPAPVLERVTVRVLSGTRAVLTALRSGDVDAAFPSGGPSPMEAMRLAEQEPQRFVTVRAPGAVWAHIDMNLDDAWLKDVRLREALFLALPRAALLDAIAPGVYTVAESYLPPWHWAGAHDEPRAPDPERARALLDAAGWHPAGDGVRHNAAGAALRLELAAASGQPEAEDLLTLAVAAWRTVGIDVVLRLQPFAVFFGEGARKRQLPHLAFYAWTLDPSTIGASMWRADRIPSAENAFTGQNFPGYRNDEVTGWLAQAETTLDLAARRGILARVQRQVRTDLPAIPWYFRPSVAIARRDVVGLAPTGTLAPLAWNAATWRRVPSP